MLPDFRHNVESVLKSLRKDMGVKVFCALEDEGWKMDLEVPAEVGIKRDLLAVNEADVLLVLVHEQPSVGAQFEIGYMVAKGKPVVLAMEAGGNMAYFNEGLVGAGLVTLITYDDPASLSQQLAIAIHAPEEELATVA